MNFSDKAIDKIVARVEARFGADAESIHRIKNYTIGVCEVMLPGDLPEELHVTIEVTADQPIPMLLWCPECGERHVDRGAFATRIHHTHACQSCGHVWKPAKVATVGVQFLPGYKDPK